MIASGGTDEVVRIFSGKKRSDVGSLMQQQGTISWIEFFQDSHLFTGSDDGTICVWDTRNWECLKTLRGHKGPVSCLSVHPSGKMLLSVAKDKTLRTWNLIKGRCAYITNLKSVAHYVTWAPNGRDFVVAIDDRIDVYNIAVGGVIFSMKFEGGKRISSIVFVSEQVIAVSADSDSINMYSLKDTGSGDDNRCIIKFKAHENRVKGLFSTFNRMSSSQDSNEGQEVFLFSVSSDGRVKLWNMTHLDLEPCLVASVDTTCRPTAFSVLIPSGSKIFQSTSDRENKTIKRKHSKEAKGSTFKKSLTETTSTETVSSSKACNPSPTKDLTNT